MSKTLHRTLKAKMDNLQGPEWDSSDEEVEEMIVKATKITKPKKTTGTKKEKKQTEEEKAADEDAKDTTVLFIGHLPSEFEERDLKNFLQQFGQVVNIRISRSVKSGKSRGYAFVRWEDAETAKIVAETLQGYFVGSKRLVCHAVPNPPRGLFFDTDKVIQRRKLRLKVEQKKRDVALSNPEKIKTISTRLVNREKKKRAKLAEMGIDYEFPGYEASHTTSTSEEEVHEETFDEGEPSPSKGEDKQQSKKKRKNSVDSVGSVSSATKKPKDSVESEPSATKKSKRKESIGSVGKTEGKSSQGKKKSSVTIDADVTPKKSKPEKAPQSEKKAKKTKKDKKRRVSAP